MLTVWKFYDFSIIHILREINFGESRSEKSTIVSHLVALNFDFLHFLEAKIDQIHTFQSPKHGKNCIF